MHAKRTFAHGSEGVKEEDLDKLQSLLCRWLMAAASGLYGALRAGSAVQVPFRLSTWACRPQSVSARASR